MSLTREASETGLHTGFSYQDLGAYTLTVRRRNSLEEYLEEVSCFSSDDDAIKNSRYRPDIEKRLEGNDDRYDISEFSDATRYVFWDESARHLSGELPVTPTSSTEIILLEDLNGCLQGMAGDQKHIEDAMKILNSYFPKLRKEIKKDFVASKFSSLF